MKTLNSVVTALVHLTATTAIAAPITKGLAEKTYLGTTTCVLAGLMVSNAAVYAVGFVAPARAVKEEDLMGNTIGLTVYLSTVATKAKQRQADETAAILAR